MMDVAAKNAVDVAIEAARKGAEVLLGYFQTELEREIKDDKTFVTKADRECEAVIMDVLKAHFPDHGFLAEETGESKTNSPYTWVIDPLDGTANFVNGLPIWAVSIALLKGNEAVAAAIYNPIVNLLVHAERGKGLWCNGVRTHVSSQSANTALISVGVGHDNGIKEKLAAIFRETPKHIKTYRYLGSAAFELATLARGGTEGFVSLGTSKWDYGAGALLVKEGGGKITNLRGEPWNFEENFFAASNGVIHDELLNVVREAGVA